MILVVTGSRGLCRKAIVTENLHHIHLSESIDILFSGHCGSGADLWCEEFATQNGIQQIWVPAPWRSPHGKASGFIRNQLMLDTAVALADAENRRVKLVAFVSKCIKPGCLMKGNHWSHGTQDCWEKALTLKIPCKYFADETII